MVLITVRLPLEATLPGAMHHYGLAKDEVDLNYGLVPIDPVQGLYALRVTEDASHRLGMAVEGPYADPKIEPFGPPL
ncbi:hypothetical protein [Sinosporangium album]|nr:hypothetical protein [Sinosporangium album]